ncbi:hypothetical protein CHARACLAT_020466 [Characodon lateralis]|nr:hypothetical protein [Ataeniobius toweri]MED6278121.1 hypothetical protein [Characodon lateralis]
MEGEEGQCGSFPVIPCSRSPSLPAPPPVLLLRFCPLCRLFAPQRKFGSSLWTSEQVSVALKPPVWMCSR